MKWIKQFWRNLVAEKALLKAENKRLRETNFALEEENEQLRKDLRGSLNTLLSQAGVQPLPDAEQVKTPTGRMRHLTLQQRQRLYAIQTTPKQIEKAG